MTKPQANYPMYVLVTGATRGMGRQIARTLAQKGVNLALCARNKEQLAILQKELHKLAPGIKIITRTADMAVKEDVLLLADAVKSEFGALDVLINNAGYFEMSRLENEKEDLLEAMLQINALAPYYLTKRLLPLLKQASRAHVVNICSISSKVPFPGAASYTVAKHAIYGLTRVMREEFKSLGIKVTAILPGSTLTSSWPEDQNPEKFVLPEDIASAVLYALEASKGANVEEIQVMPVDQ